MAYLRFSRDKRGYEHVYLVQPVTNRRGKLQHRILYWYRSPPNVKVGREPFDEAVRRALEAQNPGVEFDWEKIRATPFPPPAQAEPWRERRRAEKAARALAREDEGEVSADTALPIAVTEPIVVAGTDEGSGKPDDPVAAVESLTSPTGRPTATPGHRRRRRRRGGQRARPTPDGAAGAGIPAEPAPSSSIESDVMSDDLPNEDGSEVPGD